MATGSGLEFGLDTFGDIPEDDSGAPVTHAAAIRQVVEEGILADQIGVDVIALGEHHRGEHSISTPETVLAGLRAVYARHRDHAPLPPAVVNGILRLHA